VIALTAIDRVLQLEASRCRSGRVTSILPGDWSASGNYRSMRETKAASSVRSQAGSLSCM
jgi:hypothetical protein